MSLHSYIGLIGGVCSLAGYAPYARSVLRGETQPERATWLIWTLSSVLILMSSWELGIRDTIWVPLAFFLGSAVTTILAFVFGKEGWGNLEKLAFVVAIISSIRWIYFDQPIFTLAATMTIGALGYLTDIAQLIKDPTPVARTNLEVWTLFFMGSIFNLIAVPQWVPIQALVPVCLFIMNGLVFALAFRRALQSDKDEETL